MKMRTVWIAKFKGPNGQKAITPCLSKEEMEKIAASKTSDLAIWKYEFDGFYTEEHPDPGPSVEIDYDEARRIMDAAEYRLKTNPPDWAYKRESNEPEIFHDGKWKCLCRTDYCDDVATGWCTSKTLEQWIAYYKKKLRRRGDMPAARYDDLRFSVIDALSDG